MSLRLIEMFLPEGYKNVLIEAPVLINLICVNLAGVVTFLIQGIRPLSWWEAAKAKKATRVALITWVFLLVALVAMLVSTR